MSTDYFLGCSGFYYNHWRGRFYPMELAKNRWLQYYAERFNTLEVNNTFYRYPTEQLLQGWYQKTPADFKFTLKANRVITHTKKFRETQSYVERFYKLAFLLQEKLRCILFQLPPNAYKNMEMLENIAAQVDPKITNVLEFRHESWWNHEVYDFLERHRLVFCSVSASGLPDEVVKTAPVVYVRFHGRDGWYMQNYSDKELTQWAEKIRQKKPDHAFCYFNNDFNANAPRNCLKLRELLEA